MMEIRDAACSACFPAEGTDYPIKMHLKRGETELTE